MRGLRSIFALETKALVRSKTVATLLAFAALWMLALPCFVRGDGTAEGVRELTVRFSLGGVFLLTVTALLASATGSLAHERSARRLQLTMVRPVRFFTLVAGKVLAHAAVGAAVLAVAGAILAFKTDLSRPCSHVVSPILPSVREEAEEMYETYMKDPQTPDVVRKSKKEIVLRLLENRAVDHYQTVPTNAVTVWRFPLDGRQLESAGSVKVRMRFAAQYDTRQEVRGAFQIGGWAASVSNVTQAVVTVPLTAAASGGKDGSLSFRNDGRQSLMLRPRRDLEILTSADGFGCNLVRALAVLAALLVLVVSCGLFLSAGLGRPVALFVAFVTLIVSELAPSIVERYPDELETNVADRIGLVMTRAVSEVTRPLSSVAPLEALSKDECIERETVLRVILTDAVVLPVLLAFLAALVLPRKQSE